MKMEKEPVTRVMDHDVDLVHQDTTVDEALRICSEKKTTDLVVVDSEDRYLGMITAFEILSYINPFMGIHHGGKTMGHPLVIDRSPLISDLMTNIHLTTSEGTTVWKALKHMERDHHRFLVVVDGENRVLGRFDLCNTLELLMEGGSFNSFETFDR
jgi:CBS domain-containing protein